MPLYKHLFSNITLLQYALLLLIPFSNADGQQPLQPSAEAAPKRVAVIGEIHQQPPFIYSILTYMHRSWICRFFDCLLPAQTCRSLRHAPQHHRVRASVLHRRSFNNSRCLRQPSLPHRTRRLHLCTGQLQPHECIAGPWTYNPGCLVCSTQGNRRHHRHLGWE